MYERPENKEPDTIMRLMVRGDRENWWVKTFLAFFPRAGDIKKRLHRKQEGAEQDTKPYTQLLEGLDLIVRS